MTHAYTPGLTVTDAATIRRRRALPLRGEVLVQVGEIVAAEQVVARTHLPGPVQMVNVAALLGVHPEDVPRALVTKEGDPVEAEQVLAARKGLFGLFRAEVKSPVKGTLESVSRATGQAVLREPPVPVELLAYVDGEVVAREEGEGVTVETRGALVQGIFGLGGERSGRILCQEHAERLEDLPPNQEHDGQILVIPGRPSAESLRQAAHFGVRAVVCGSVDDHEVKELLGRELGVAITGDEEIGLTLVVTEGFGRLKMAPRTFELLKRYERMRASVNGATQIRAGVLRPEVIVPRNSVPSLGHSRRGRGKMVVGSRVRIIRQPHFGTTAQVTGLPVELVQVPSEARVRAVDLRLPDGETITLPRANVELIEDSDAEDS